MGNKLRVAVFGTGYWAQFQIAAWQAIGADVCSVWNRTRSRAEETAKKFGVAHVFSSPREVFGYGEFDVADIITDPVCHEELTAFAAENGKPVICQKPMASTLEGCERMVKNCARRGVWFAVHENFRFQPQFRILKKLLDDGKIGKIDRAKLQLRSPDRGIIAAQPALLNMQYMAYLDMGPHIFDVARYLFGEIKSVASHPRCTYKDLREDMVDEADSVLSFQSGLVIECNLVHKCDYKAEIEGERGKITVAWDNTVRLTAEGQEIVTAVVPEKLPYIPQKDWALHGGHVFAAIPACLKMLAGNLCEGKPAETSGEDNLKTMRAVYAAIQSAQAGGASVRI